VIQVEDKTTEDGPSKWNANEAEYRFWNWIRLLTTYALGAKTEANNLGYLPEEKVAFLSSIGAISRMVLKYASDKDRAIYEKSIQNALEVLEPEAAVSKQMGSRATVKYLIQYYLQLRFRSDDRGLFVPLTPYP
jgi:hypothetical protein